MFEIKTEILEICEAFNLGSYIGMTTKGEIVKGFQLTEFRTSKGVFTHYYKIK